MPSMELSLQKKVRDAVIEDGGFVQIISHRFVVGVPDMAVKVLMSPATSIIEVKQQLMPVRSETVKLEATAKQILSLNKWANAGTPAGILSFLVKGGRAQKKQYFAGVFGVPWVNGEFHWDPMGEIRVPVAQHFPVDSKCRDVVPLLTRFSTDWNHFSKEL